MIFYPFVLFIYEYPGYLKPEKIMQTLDLINSQIVGFSLINDHVIKNDTILAVLFQTITLFFLVTRMV